MAAAIEPQSRAKRRLRAATTTAIARPIAPEAPPTPRRRPLIAHPPDAGDAPSAMQTPSGNAQTNPLAQSTLLTQLVRHPPVESKQRYGVQSSIVPALVGHAAPALEQNAAPCVCVGSTQRIGAHCAPDVTGAHAPAPLHVVAHEALLQSWCRS